MGRYRLALGSAGACRLNRVPEQTVPWLRRDRGSSGRVCTHDPERSQAQAAPCGASASASRGLKSWAVNERRRFGKDVPILGAEVVTVYLLGVPNQGVSDVPELKKPLSPLRIKGSRIWWPGAESNHRHKDFQSSALPTELPGLSLRLYIRRRACPGSGRRPAA
jgi:hypothetical protein